jgi:hypothetical protein
MQTIVNVLHVIDPIKKWNVYFWDIYKCEIWWPWHFDTYNSVIRMTCIMTSSCGWNWTSIYWLAWMILKCLSWMALSRINLNIFWGTMQSLENIFCWNMIFLCNYWVYTCIGIEGPYTCLYFNLGSSQVVVFSWRLI